MEWTDERVKDLESLLRLLRDVSSLNRGNCHLEKTAKCIAVADALMDSDVDRRHWSFTAWLEQAANEYVMSVRKGGTT